MFFYFVTKNIQENDIAANEHIAKQINANIASLQNSVYDISLMVLQNPYNYDNDVGYYYITRSQHLLSLIAIARKQDSSFTGIYERGYGFARYDEFAQMDIYSKIISAQGKPVWFTEKKDSPKILPQLPSDKVVMARTMVNDQNSFQSDDILLLGVSPAIIGELCKIDSLSDKSQLLITDVDSQLIYQSSERLFASFGVQDPAGSRSFEYIYEGVRSFVSAENDNPYKWNVFLITREKGIFADGIPGSLLAGFVITTIVVFITFVIVLLLSKSLTKPIKKLTASIDKMADGTWSHHVEIMSNDEIGELGTHYNDMIDDLHDLVDQNYVLTLREREAELSALQTQINPHFLYNTLNTFYIKSYAADQYELASLVIALSQMFRTSLSEGNTWIPVAGEKDFLGNYLLLQKQQFGARLEYQIDFNPAVLPYFIPKLILQPFVENALLHGLGKTSTGGKIMISGWLTTGRLMFTVQDNGDGMDAETLYQIRHLPEDKPTKGYALWNIRERLKLYYNYDYTLEYESEPGKGVRVYIEVPVRQGDDVKQTTFREKKDT